MIFTNLAPNSSIRDVLILSSFFVLPWRWGNWYEGKAQYNVRTWFQQYLDTEHVYLLDSGRSALLVALRAMDLKKGDEVIVPGYTCIVVTNAIRAVGAVPKLVDITGDLNIDASAIEKEIRPHTKAILAQHTFGLPCDLAPIRMLCERYHLKMIEDCAHALGAHAHERPVGSFGDVAFFSFGSDKIVSSVRGGALIIHDEAIAHRIEADFTRMPRNILWQHICYLSAFAKIKLFYRFGGKAMLYLLRTLGVTAVITQREEKEGRIASWTPTVYPNILAAIVYPQLRKLYKVKMKRRAIASYYLKHLPNEVLTLDYSTETDRTYLHLPIMIGRVGDYRAYMKQHGIQVGTDWNNTPIAPESATQIDTEEQHIPTAESLSKKVVQLPIHQNMTIRKVKKVVACTYNFLKT
jgi:dTDP-4-amino-4,6-dideoxygalactose transaminase